jgi:hypothetical protein
LSFRSITFLTDFGVQDDFVGVCRGVMRRIAPDATVIDISHGIAPQGVAQGAIILARSVPYMPVCVHLAVVDPGVGSDRRSIAIRTRGGRYFVGPDNGLLMLAADAEGVEAARVLTNPAFHLDRVSHTFHARDVFAPVAAHLAAGVALEELGDELDSRDLVGAVRARHDRPLVPGAVDRLVRGALDLDQRAGHHLVTERLQPRDERPRLRARARHDHLHAGASSGRLRPFRGGGNDRRLMPRHAPWTRRAARRRPPPGRRRSGARSTSRPPRRSAPRAGRRRGGRRPARGSRLRSAQRTPAQP